MNDVLSSLEDFIAQWQDSPEQNKKGLLYLKKVLESLNGVNLDFIPREGLTYSLRAKHPNQKEKELFVMVDVIEGEPRWLSVCFYAEMISDPDGKGDLVPEGLLGEDAICFDVDQYSEEALEYIQQRIIEAHASAAE